MKISLGSKQLIVSFKNKPGRPKKTLARRVRSFVAFLSRVWSDNRFTGNRLSRVLRRVFEFGRIKQLVGFNLAMIGFATSTQLPTLAVNQLEPLSVENQFISITTTKAVQSPVRLVEISQKYHSFHPGVDLRAPLGTPVRPVMIGQIEKVINQHYGYGNYVIVDHQNGYESLYAHLYRIEVKEGAYVDHQTILGTVG